MTRRILSEGMESRGVTILFCPPPLSQCVRRAQQLQDYLGGSGEAGEGFPAGAGDLRGEMG